MSRSKLSGVILLMLMTGISHAGFSLTLYVSTHGNDANTGTARAPFATLEAARDHVRKLRKSGQLNEPVEILISKGTYYISMPIVFTQEDSGKANAPLIVRGKDGDRPIFSGGVLLPSFQKISEQLWKIEVPNAKMIGGAIQQLFVNGRRATSARTPNQGIFYKVRDVSETLGTAQGQPALQKITLTADQFKVALPPSADTGSLIISIHHAWDRTRKYVSNASIQDTSVTISGKPMKPWNKLNNSAQFYFENRKSFLDQAGEFFYDPEGTLYYIPRSAETIANTNAIVPVTEQLLILEGNANQPLQHIQFEHLSFQHTRHVMPFEGEEPQQAAASTEATIMVNYANNIHFKDCEFAHTGNNGIWFKTGCQHSSVSSSYLHDLGIGGLKIGDLKIPTQERTATGYIVIDNNIIRTGGQVNPTGIGVMIFQSADNTISHNEIADFRYTGISVGWIWGYAESPAKRNKILNNHIHHLGWGELSDMGGIYTLGRSEGTLVRGNVIHDIYSYGYGGWGLYTDEGSSGIVMENNLVYNCKNAGFHQHYGKGNIIKNNIFALQIKAQLQATRIEPDESFRFTRNIIYYSTGKLGDSNWDKVNAVKDSNLYWNTASEKIKLINEKHSVIEDPMFKDPLRYNFRLKRTLAAEKIGFKPFDYAQAGVYGSRSWKKLAVFDPDLNIRFQKILAQRLRDDEGISH